MNTGYDLKEIRVIVGPKLNHCFVWIKITSGDYMPCVDGWHYKATTLPALDFLAESLAKSEQLLWPQMAPPEPTNREAYEALE